MNVPTAVEPYLTARDLAKKYGVNISWVYRACRTGTLAHMRVGQQIRFTPDHQRTNENRLAIAPRDFRRARRTR